MSLLAPTLTGTVGDQRAYLVWNVVAAVKYNLRRGTGTGWYSTIYTGSATAFKDIGLTNGTVYHYRVRGTDAKGHNGPWSNVVTLTPRAAVIVTPFVGYGDKVTGGDADKANPIVVRTWADLKAAMNLNRLRYVQMSPSAGVIDGLGERLKFAASDVTLDWSGSPAVVKRGWLSGVGPLHNVKIIEARIRPGDEVAAPSDADPLSFNAATGMVDGVLIDRCSLMWGPDIGGATFLANWQTQQLVRNVTMMRTINGPGLQQSANPEASGVISSDHAKTSNVTSLPSGDIKDWTDFSGVLGCDRITFYRNLYFGGHERSPQVHWATLVDLINSVTYNWWGGAAVEGTPRGLNIVGHVAVAGPETLKKAYSAHFFMLDLKPNQAKPFPNSVYIEDPLCLGFAYANLGRMSEAQTSSPVGGQPLSVPRSLILPSSQVLESVLAEVGPTIRDSVDASLIAAVRNRTNTVYNGAGFPPPHPSW